jgi:hypothetical protein
MQTFSTPNYKILNTKTIFKIIAKVDLLSKYFRGLTESISTVYSDIIITLLLQL